MDGASTHPTRYYVWPEISPAEQALQRLEAELFELWGHLNAATCRFLELVAEFDRSEGWARHGVASCAQWLTWQCGIGAVAAREKVRVARALESLPKISDSFRRGVISYSKVRAMTRIATPENEAALVNVAEHGTAAHVEKLVRKYRWVERLEDAARANDQHYARYLHLTYDDDGSVLLHAKLPPEVGAIVRKAIEMAVELERTSETAEPATRTQSNVSAGTSESEPYTVNDEHGAKRADALRRVAECFLAHGAETRGSVADRYQVVVHIDQRLLASASVDAPGRCELSDERPLAIETARRLGCDCSAVGLVEDEHGEPLNVGRKTRSLSPALQRALKARDGGCRFPGCDRTRFTEGHHVKHWAEGGETKLSNLVTLCSFHHRLVHEGGFGLRRTDDGVFVFTRPDGSRVEENGRLRWRFRGSVSTLREINLARGVDIDTETSRCRWTGEHMDYGLAVGYLIEVRNRCAGALRGQAP